MKKKSIFTFFLFLLLVTLQNSNADTIKNFMQVIPTTAAPWPKGIIPYYFDDSINNQPTKKAEILRLIKEINKKTNLFLKPYDGKDFINPLLITQNKTNGCNAHGFGYWRTGLNYINLADICFTSRVVLHEFGHVFGLDHEHKHPDRDQYLKLHYSSTEYAHAGFKFNIIDKYSTDYVMARVPFDFKSIMLYPSTQLHIEDGNVTRFYNLDQPPTISAKAAYVNRRGFSISTTTKVGDQYYYWIAPNENYSAKDINTINTLHANEMMKRSLSDIEIIKREKLKITRGTIRPPRTARRNQGNDRSNLDYRDVNGTSCVYKDTGHWLDNKHQGVKDKSVSCICNLDNPFGEYLYTCYDVSSSNRRKIAL